jgi:hypothetical protein
MPFVQMNTDEMILPVLIPRAAEPAVTGLNSTWLIAGAAAASWMLFGSKVTKPKPQPRGKKLKI